MRAVDRGGVGSLGERGVDINVEGEEVQVFLYFYSVCCLREVWRSSFSGGRFIAMDEVGRREVLDYADEDVYGIGLSVYLRMDQQ